MASKNKRFADDGWAVWVNGDDISTVYINDWLNPNGKSYVDFAVRIRGIKDSKALHVYVPFSVTKEEILDTSLCFKDEGVLRATFSTAGIIDYKKNECTSEIAYNGRTIDLVHISCLDYELTPLASGTLMSINLEELQKYLANDEAYFLWRMPHKSLDKIFEPHIDMGGLLTRVRDLITSPVVSEKYGYSIRINEARLLPSEINRIGAFHRQKLKKAVISISVDESYSVIRIVIVFGAWRRNCIRIMFPMGLIVTTLLLTNGIKTEIPICRVVSISILTLQETISVK